jgi:uncharacterized membrane protein YhaH (DUF805 family)
MNVIALLILIPIVVSAILVGIKRLHDRNRSAWWLVALYGMPILGLLLSDFREDTVASSLPIIVIHYVGFAALIWAIIELGCLRGTIGGNQYGGDPLAPQPAPPRTMVR